MAALSSPWRSTYLPPAARYGVAESLVRRWLARGQA